MQSTPYPLGPSLVKGGINFSIYAPHAKEVVINFPEKGNSFPLREKTGEVWHIFLPLEETRVTYHYLIDGQVVIDPWAKEIASSHAWGAPWQAASLISDVSFDWQEVVRPKHKKEELILYEMHVRGFTQDPSCSVQHPGTFLGLIEKIPYLVELGINAVELMPVHEFDETEYPNHINFWGYSPVSFFALMNRYAVGDAAIEFKTLVRELHRAKIEVILDVVYNHSSKKEKSPFTALAKEVYYILEDGVYNNDTGCGNTLQCDHLVTSELILHSLRYFAHEFQVDGFRFDLATILKRDSSWLIKAISDDPLLKECKLIAEPWDPVHYNVGGFYPSLRWSEWNDKFRDAVRTFIKGDSWKKGEFATRLAGSEDLYEAWGSPASSLNFVTAHDGFSLHDLVSYNTKHNEMNGENNADGTHQNYSWNCGAEGATEDPEILALRLRQMKNFFLALFLAKGIPMIHMGDEYGHTKQGNNNTWCQDNPLSWFQWGSESPLTPYLKTLIQLRKTEKILTEDLFLTKNDIEWHGPHPHHPLWNSDNHFLAFTLKKTLYAAFNASNHSQTVFLPEGDWHLVVSSSQGAISPQIIMEPFSSLLLKRADPT